MDTEGCSLCIFSRANVTAILLFLLTIFGRLACGAGSGLLCYSCTNVPHPRDCKRIVRCGPTEECSIESFITPAGHTVHNMGCSSQLKCHNAVSLVGRREFMLAAIKKRLAAIKKREDVKICIECCNNASFCNRELCDTKVNLTGKICMQCDNVENPLDCATVALCQPGEICYTESKILYGEKRYRLGCVNETSCQVSAARGTITTISPFLDSCGICCKREIENCNLELCDQRGGSPPKDIVQMYLKDPPIDYNGVYCHDKSETGCILAGADRPDFCDNSAIKNYLCPKLCGTCDTTIATSVKPSRGGSGLLCYSCTNVPHSRDCNRIVRCGPTEACSVETFITPSGHTVYNMGCSSQLKCHNQAVSLVGRRESMLAAIKKREDVIICIECCTSGSFCNRKLCDTKVNLTGKLCMQCDDVANPMDCDTVALCQPGEICYTESKIIHGEKRYRLGCVKETSCQVFAAPGTITTNSPLLDSCRICCKSEIENCNLELCDQRGGSPPKDIVQMYLKDPPIGYNEVYCHDESETGCILAGADRPGFCDNPAIKNHLCPKFCGTCATTSVYPPRGDCFFESSLYIGQINKTIDNVTCDSWDAHLLHSDPLALKLPDASLSDAANYCRDPDEKGHPWCYVNRDPHHKTWEFCDVLFCRECYFANRSHDYNGYVTASMNGKCLAWTGTSFPDSSFPDGSVTRAKNYCRDPDNRGYPHCPTSHGFLPCVIPKCNDYLCADDPGTLCVSLKLVICGVKDMARKLCPKTCGMCGFGLMPPVHIKPPVHTDTQTACEDNSMAKCDTLKQFICGNAQASQLCPKTCNLCSANRTIGVRSMTSTTSTISTPPPTITQGGDVTSYKVFTFMKTNIDFEGK